MAAPIVNAVLSFDWGTTIVGVLDVNAGIYTPYRGSKIIEGVLRLTECIGTIVSFNGNSYDLPKMAEYIGMTSMWEMRFRGSHDDMLDITSAILWPGPTPIVGSGGLEERFRRFCCDAELSTSPMPDDPYVDDNWRDCFMAAELWKKWKRGELAA
jgi:hypothetical protein